jgi:HAD superfamily hydrolase (TIGR01509 family)
MIKAIIFDCFGVLSEDAWMVFNNTYRGQQDIFQAAHELNEKSDLGLITEDELYHNLADLLDRPFEDIKKSFTSEQKNTDILNYIPQLKRHYKIGMLSNVNRGFMDHFFTQEEKDLFDVMVLSGEIGVAKPDTRAFVYTVEKMGVAIDESVMVDDRQYNVDGAMRAGMNGILYRDFEQLKKDLNSILEAM